MSPNLLKLLMAGEYICPIRYRNEYELLDIESEQEAVDDWLRRLGMRLARVNDAGAFFMAPSVIGPKETSQVRAELLKFRDEFGPAVRLLDFIRQVKAENALMSPGEYIQLVELDMAVAESSSLEAQLKTLPIPNSAQRLSRRESLKRLVEHLCKDGYLVLVSKDTETYQVSGKIEQMYAVLSFLDENQVIPNDEIDDQIDPSTQQDLVDAAVVIPIEGSDA